MWPPKARPETPLGPQRSRTQAAVLEHLAAHSLRAVALEALVPEPLRQPRLCPRLAACGPPANRDILEDTVQPAGV